MYPYLIGVDSSSQCRNFRRGVKLGCGSSQGAESSSSYALITSRVVPPSSEPPPPHLHAFLLPGNSLHPANRQCSRAGASLPALASTCPQHVLCLHMCPFCWHRIGFWVILTDPQSSIYSLWLTCWSKIWFHRSTWMCAILVLLLSLDTFYCNGWIAFAYVSETYSH